MADDSLQCWEQLLGCKADMLTVRTTYVYIDWVTSHKTHTHTQTRGLTHAHTRSLCLILSVRCTAQSTHEKYNWERRDLCLHEDTPLPEISKPLRIREDYLVPCGCSVSKLLAGFGGAAMSDPWLLGVLDLSLLSDPSAAEAGRGPSLKTVSIHSYVWVIMLQCTALFWF